jgi:hypothetical protein
VVVAELALPAQVHDPAVVGALDLREVAVVAVDGHVQHVVEGGAQAVAAAAAVAQARDAGELLLDGRRVEVRRVPRIVGHG